MTNRTIFLTTALPYANGNFHFGHIMEYIQADIWVRHQRMCGSTVHFVGADDAHGAPIMISAQKKGVTPQEYVAEISAGRAKYLNGFFIRFDHWHSTDSKENTELTVTLSTPDYMSKETAEKLKPFLRRPIIYQWKDGMFTR